MKKLIYAVKTELSDKAGLFFNIITTTLIIFFVLLFFGSYYGSLKANAKAEIYYVEVYSSTMTLENLEKIKSLKGYQYAMLSCEEQSLFMPEISVNSFLNSPGENFALEGTPIEKNDDPNYIYVPYSGDTNYGEIGDTFSLGINKAANEVRFFKIGKPKEGYEAFELNICGTFGLAAGGNAVYVSPEFLFEHLTPSYAEICFDALKLTEDEYSANIRTITDVLGEPDRNTDFETGHESAIKFTRRMSYLLFVFGMISLLFLYSYTLSRKIRRFSIAKMCGASKGTIAFMITSAGLLNYILSFLLAVALGNTLNVILFKPVFGFNAFELRPEDYLSFFTVTFVVYLIVSLIYIIRFTKNSAISIYRRSE